MNCHWCIVVRVVDTAQGEQCLHFVIAPETAIIKDDVLDPGVWRAVQPVLDRDAVCSAVEREHHVVADPADRDILFCNAGTKEDTVLVAFNIRVGVERVVLVRTI